MKSIHVLRKPCSESTVAANVVKHGTGGLNIDASRIAWANAEDAAGVASAGVTFAKSNREGLGQSNSIGRGLGLAQPPSASGRWPANLVLGACIDGELDSVFPHNKSQPIRATKPGRSGSGVSFAMTHSTAHVATYADDSGSAARYFKRVSE